MQNHSGKVEITEHAMERLLERVKSHGGYRSWQHMVKEARYNGKPVSLMTDEEYRQCLKQVKHMCNSSQVRLLDGFFFIFRGNKGHARTLVTVFELKESANRGKSHDE